MLQTLRRIVQEVNAARDLEQALEIIVRRVKQAMGVDACSIYLHDNQAGQLVMMATDGLNPESVGSVRLMLNEGLTGLVAERAELVNMGNAPKHPRYHYFPESGEERYGGFLGVPVIHHRKVMGVLVVQQKVNKPFNEDSVTFLMTIAAQLAGAIAHAEASGGIDGLQISDEPNGNRPIQGLPGAAGVAVGTAVVVYPASDLDAVPERRTRNIRGEQAAFKKAVAATRDEIQQMSERFGKHLPDGERALFDAYLLMLDGDSLVEKTLDRIREGNWAQGALRDTVREHVQVFDAMDDSYMRERGSDIHDLGNRVLMHLQDNPRSRRKYSNDTVLVGEEITATMLTDIPLEKLAGVVSCRGSRSSHVAILARAMGIPAVMGTEELPVDRIDGYTILADGYTGRVYLNPSKRIRSEYKRLQKEEAELSEELITLRNLPAETTDGVKIELCANTGLVADIGPALSSGAQGVGLYRTEFPFMLRDRFPGEDEQQQVYREVLEAFTPRPVTMRTLDVGGDKALPYFPIEEDNPFLGWRGIRITLEHPEIFVTQMRAMLRASAGLDNLKMLLPMISSVSEVDETMALLHRAHEELLEEGNKITFPKVGVMIEVPSAVYQTKQLAKRVDFLSVGSNDLTQYLLAVDRNNARVAEMYDALHPAVIAALMQVMEGARELNTPVSVCGEMAGDPAAALLLLGMGIDSLSMSASSLLRVKWVVRSFSQKRAKKILDEVLEMEDGKLIREHLNGVLDEAGLGGLIRAGK